MIINILLIPAYAYSQEFGSNLINSDPQNTTVKKSFNPDVSVQLGTSFTSFAGGNSGFGTFVMPEFTFPINKKFAIRAGLGYSNTFYLTPYSENNSLAENSMHYGTVYVSGLYRLNPKLTIAGTAYKTFNLNKQGNLEAYPFNYSNQGIMMNLDYEVTEKFRINVGISYREQNTPYSIYDHAGFNMYPSPFNYNGFGGGFYPGF